MISKITLTVVPSEYKAHKKEWYASKVKELVAYPEGVDCIAKKRKWLAHNSAGSKFYIIDDDVEFLVWSSKADNHLCAKDHPKGFALLQDYLLEGLPEVFDKDRAVATFSGRFMAKMTLRDKGPISNSVGYCAVMYRKSDAVKMEYNRMMFYNDADLVMQSLVMTGKKPVQHLGVIIQKRNTKKFDGTGADVYRNDVLVNDSLTRIVRYQRGRVYGRKPPNDHSLQNRLSLSYQNAYKWSSLSKSRQAELIERSRLGVEEMLEGFKLEALPPLFTFEYEEPRQEIINRITSDWKRLQRK